ncbi:BlaR1 peptidase M56 [Rubripirellula tenax]|uniref:BlaR1 peptidase M56 n=1 Tax=Rubripirellula tenax TaxID=2528015 RepID=A0A5C6EID3_9BACT|nr:M56 family metallopeptidase [Rubripirellula tenax]TWU48812.1 BlaR1 peptidase M56 [Rubripirellula tenax]
MIDCVISNAIIASLIAAVAWFGSRIYQRPALWHVIWLIAMVKLFVPPVWPVPVASVGDKLVGTSLSRASQATTEFRPIDLPIASRSSVDPIANANASLATNIDSADHSPAYQRLRDTLPVWSWLSFIAIVWVVGAAFVLVKSLLEILRFHGLVSSASVADEATGAMLVSAAAMLGKATRVPSVPSVRMIDRAIPPLLWPIGSVPPIVLPTSWWDTTTDQERRTVLMHELVHWRRGDHWVRLLHWLANITFWWHPLVWIARGELHRLEEHCCDAEVMHRLPNSGRAYASALLSASQWLTHQSESNSSRCHPSRLAMPMSDLTHFQSFYRRIEMLPTLRHSPWTRRRIYTVLLAAVMPLAISLSVNAQTSENESKSATLAGQVSDLDGKPIADAKVRVVIPAADLRVDAIAAGDHREFWGTTDGKGNYSIDVDGIDEPSSASVDVLHPGHRRLVGTLMLGGDPNEVTLKPGEKVAFDAKLPESLYFAGRLVDEANEPIQGAMVFSSLRDQGASYGIEHSMTDSEGRFSVYCYSQSYFHDQPGQKGPMGTARVWVQHDRFMDAEFEKLEDVESGKRDELVVVLKSGFSIGGTVMDADGSPAADYEISLSQPGQRKAVRTDNKGKFRFDGVQGGESTIRVVNVAKSRKAIEKIDVDSPNLEMEVKLQVIASPVTTTHSILGMTLADVTSELDQAYDLDADRIKGVMIVDPGNEFESLEIGELRAGFVIWMVGNDRVANFDEMLRQLVKEAKTPTVPQGAQGNTSAIPLKDGGAMVRVVYAYNTVDSRGTNTQYMKLTADQIAELEKLVPPAE